MLIITSLLLALPAPRLSAAASVPAKADADALLARGRTLIQQEGFPGARTPLEQALAVYRQSAPSKEQAETILALGDLLVDLAQVHGDYDTAIGYYGRARGIPQSLHLQKEEADASARLGGLAALLAQYGNAAALYQQALVMYRQLGVRRQQAGEPVLSRYLTRNDVMQLTLQADLVALMACDTGAGKVVGGERAMTMRRAVQCAGARSVPSGLWQAEDVSTNLLTETFLHEIETGKDKVTALQMARQRLRDAGYVHPFYWANFVLIGEQGAAGLAKQ